MAAYFNLHEEQESYGALPRRWEDRLAWLRIEDRVLISALGDVWPEFPPVAPLHRMLDIGCGSGDWLIEVARRYPSISQLFGVDRNRNQIAQARDLARAAGVDDRVEFHVMDALCMLEFPFDFLDLVNIQMGGYTFRTWEWPKLLNECRRVTRPGGIVRAVEQDFIGEDSSQALDALMQLLIQTYYHAGFLFTPTRDGLARELPALFERFGMKHVDYRTYPLNIDVHTPEWQDFIRAIPPALAPFVGKWGRLPDNYEDLCGQALEEVARPDFQATWTLTMVWGSK